MKNLSPSFVAAFAKDPSLINNVYYIMHNIEKLGLFFNDYPEEFRKDDLFITSYFSQCKTTKKEYKNIPDHLLKNPFFVHSCLKVNPDIYLLADASCHNVFAVEKLKLLYPQSYAKYAFPEQLADKKFCLDAVTINKFNYQYLPEEQRCDKDIILKALKEYGTSVRYVSEMGKYIPQKMMETEAQADYLLNYVSKTLFPHLPAKFRENPYIVKKILSEDTNYLLYTTDALKNNEEFIHSVMQIASNDFSKISASTIMQYLPIKYFTDDFCYTYKDHLVDIYNVLPKEHKQNQHIIKYAFEAASPSRAYELISCVPNKELKEYLKESKKIHKGAEKKFHSDAVNIISSYFLKKELEESLSNENKKITRVKI